VKAISTFLAVSSLASTFAAGLLGMVVVRAVGSPLAMGARMWLGDTEPSSPHVPWPMVATFFALMLPVPWLYRRDWKIAGIAALPFALLPFWQLYRLYLAAAPG